MNTFAKFFLTGSLALAATVTSSFATDTDPSYNVGWAGAGLKPEAANRPANRYAPEYLRPTQRYYGKGFTVAYRFVPWSDRIRSLNSTSMWDSDQMRLPINSAAAISSGDSPRVTYIHRTKPSVPASAPSLPPDQNNATGSAMKPLPPISGAPAKP